MTTLGLQQRLENRTPARTAAAEREVVMTPAVAITETAELFRLTADMPGVHEKAVEIQLDRNRLTIRGRPAEGKPAGGEWLYREHWPRTYERSFTLSNEIDRGKVKATVKNGVLNLELPKVKEVRPQRIEVRAG